MGFEWACEQATDKHTGPFRVRFLVGQTDIDAQQQQDIDEWARATIDEPEGGLAMVGVINAEEGDQAPQLARRRAEAVHTAFVERGVSPKRLSVAVEQGQSAKESSFVFLRPVLDPPE